MSVQLSPFTGPATPAAAATGSRGVRRRRPLLGRPARNRHVELFVLPRVGGPSLTPGAYAGLAR
jgi:hypothetical protein